MPLLTGLVSYYKFDENSGTIVGDLVNGNTGTWNGILGSQWATGKINSAGSFNGTTNSNYVVCKSGFILAGNTNLTVSVWVNTSNVPTSNGGAAIYCERAASGNDIFKLEIAGSTGPGNLGDFQFTYRDDGATLNQGSTGANLINNGAWHNCVLTKTGTVVLLYIDAVSKGTMNLTATNSFTDASPQSRIGGDRGDPGAYYPPGMIDEVGLWNVALSAADITTLYNSGLGLQYPFTIDVGRRRRGPGIY